MKSILFALLVVGPIFALAQADPNNITVFDSCPKPVSDDGPNLDCVAAGDRLLLDLYHQEKATITLPQLPAQKGYTVAETVGTCTVQLARDYRFATDTAEGDISVVGQAISNVTDKCLTGSQYLRIPGNTDLTNGLSKVWSIAAIPANTGPLNPLVNDTTALDLSPRTQNDPSLKSSRELVPRGIGPPPPPANRGPRIQLFLSSTLYLAVQGYNLLLENIRAITDFHIALLAELARRVRYNFDHPVGLDPTFTINYQGWVLAISSNGWHSWEEAIATPHFNLSQDDIYQALLQSLTAMSRDRARSGVFQLVPDTQNATPEFPHGQYITFTLTRRRIAGDVERQGL